MKQGLSKTAILISKGNMQQEKLDKSSLLINESSNLEVIVKSDKKLRYILKWLLVK